MISLSDTLSRIVYFVINLRLSADLVFCVQMIFDIYLSCNTDTVSSVCWFTVHILHCWLLIKKRTEQIRVHLYEWTREKHNSPCKSRFFYIKVQLVCSLMKADKRLHIVCGGWVAKSGCIINTGLNLSLIKQFSGSLVKKMFYFDNWNHFMHTIMQEWGRWSL